MKIILKTTIIALITVFSMALCTYAQIPKDKASFQGDDAFKSDAMKGFDDDISTDALFVSTKGRDSNKGTIDSPFASVQKALDTVKAGQTIYVRGGKYDGLNTFKTSGTQANYITIRNYPNETPYLTCTSGTNGAILLLNNCSYIKIYGLEIGGHTAQQAYGILLNSKEHHIIISNNNIHNLATTKPGENENGEANGILIYGEATTDEEAINNIYIENNSLHNNTTGWCETLSATGNCKYINIINNTVYDNTNIGIDFYGNAGYCSVKSLDQPRYCVAAGNTIYGSKCSYAECAGLYLDGARDTIFENNIVYGNMYGIEIGSEELQANYPVKNIIVRNNLVYNNPYGGIRVGGYDKKKTGYVTSTKIYNNTLANNGEGEGGYNGEFCFVKCNGIDVKNNLVYKSSNKYPLIGGDLPAEYTLNVTFNNNLFYDTNDSENVYFEYKGQSISGIDTFNKYVNGTNFSAKPTLNNDYSLAENSYGIDLGDNSVLNDMGSLSDISNNYRAIGTIDIGAYEYQDGSKPTVTTASTTTTEAATETTTFNIADLNKDGKVNSLDTEFMLKIITGIKDGITAPDLNNDGKIDLLDVFWYLVKKISYVWNYTTGENTDNFFAVNANEYKSASTINYNDLTLTKAIKMESGTSITFIAPCDGKLKVIANGGNDKSIKVNKTSYSIISGGETEIPVKEGSIEIKKGTTGTYLYYITFEKD